MTKISSTLRVFCFAALTLSGLGVQAQELEPFADTSRLVSIGGSLTEIIYELGEEDLLVARDSTGLYPEAATELPDVGYMRQLSPEGVLSVSPSALLVIEGSGPPEVLDVLMETGVPYQTVPESYSAEGILTKVRAVGQALDVTDKADALADELKAQLDRVADQVADIEDRKRVLFVLSLQGGRVQASGTGTAADGVIELAGAENAITAFEGYRPLAEEAVIEANPDVILVMTRGGDHGASADELLANPGLAMTTAGQNGAVIRMDGSYLLNFGPRAPEAIHELARAIYGDEVE